MAIEVDEYFGWSYTAKAMCLLSQRHYDAAIEAASKSITCQPNDADAHAYLGFIANVRELEGASRAEALERVIALTHIARVLHQAALGSVPRSVAEPMATFRANAEAFAGLLECCRRAGIERFVFYAGYLASQLQIRVTKKH